jgi:hypothetical protein
MRSHGALRRVGQESLAGRMPGGLRDAVGKRFRSWNLLERSLEEVKRRTKVIGRFPGETSCLSMCWAVLDLFLAGAGGVGLSDLQSKQVGSMKIARAHRGQKRP